MWFLNVDTPAEVCRTCSNSSHSHCPSPVRRQVHAKHEEKSDSRSVYREYNREFLLPQGSNPEMIKSSLSKDGILTVEAPLPAVEGGSGHIPITHQ